MENKNQPAYPVEGYPDENGKFHGVQTSHNSGMFGGLTKREYFAGLAMQGFCANDVIGRLDTKTIVKYSLSTADELLKQLDNGK